MPIYMTIIRLPKSDPLTPERVIEIARMGQEDPQVRGYRSFHSLTEGQIVWLLDAPSREAVTTWCARMELPMEGITELELEGHVGVLRQPPQEIPPAFSNQPIPEANPNS